MLKACHTSRIDKNSYIIYSITLIYKADFLGSFCNQKEFSLKSIVFWKHCLSIIEKLLPFSFHQNLAI